MRQEKTGWVKRELRGKLERGSNGGLRHYCLGQPISTRIASPSQFLSNFFAFLDLCADTIHGLVFHTEVGLETLRLPICRLLSPVRSKPSISEHVLG